MKNHSLSVILIVLFSAISYSQEATIQKLNLDFEQQTDTIPKNWKSSSKEGYKVYGDSENAISGSYSAVIEASETANSFNALSIELPHNYIGKKIRLTGYIKTENVTDGFAGLWMRIDHGVAFDNMQDRGVTGTTDWKKYEIELEMDPEKTEQIIIGGLLVGKGKVWFDNFEVTIDGKHLDHKNLKVYHRIKLPAEEDTAFDAGSEIILSDLDAETVNNLEVLGKIWGFLKYHHPAIASGDYNWDYELFRMLPDYLKVKNKQERDEVLAAWIEKYGKLSKCKKCKPTPEDAVLKPDLSWIDNSDLSQPLKKSLKEVYANRNQGKHYYISLHPKVNNPDFKNENPYSQMTPSDDGFKLLSLFRYWNMIEYFFPNKHLTDKKWDTVLGEYIPIFIEAKDKLAYELAVLQLIGEVSDTHANLWGGGHKIFEMRGDNFAAFRGEFVEDKFVVVDYYNPEYADESKLKIGDIITHINGKNVEAIIDSLKPYYPASNEAARLRDIAGHLLRSPKEEMTLEYISNNQKLQHKISLYHYNHLNLYHLYKVDENEKCYKLLDGNIGYITLANIQEEDIPVIKKSFINTKGIIIDIRNYPSYFVPFALGSYFVSKTTPFVKFTEGNINNPGEFTFTKAHNIPNSRMTYKGKLVVLVNERSQSQAEYTAMAFRAGDNTTIIGSSTAGADGNISSIVLPGKMETIISGIGVYYPDGTETQRVGIVPDIEVRPTIEGVKQGKDELLEKAIEIINQ